MKTPSTCFFLIFLFFVYSCQKTPSSPGGGGGQKQFFSCADTTAKIPKEKFFLVDPSQNEDSTKHIYKKISTALKASEEVEDSHICVKPATYQNSFSIHNKENLTLECQKPEDHSCIIQGETNEIISLPMNLISKKNSITIRGFTLKGSTHNSGIEMTSSTNIFLSDLLIEGNARTGITILMSENIHLHNIHLRNNLRKQDEAELHITSSNSVFTVTGYLKIENAQGKGKILINGTKSNETSFEVDSEALRESLNSFGVNYARIKIISTP